MVLGVGDEPPVHADDRASCRFRVALPPQRNSKGRTGRAADSVRLFCGTCGKLTIQANCLECVSILFLQVAPGDEGAAEREKGFVDVRAAFVAQREAAEAMQPGQGAFDTRRKTPGPLP
jgi:hypothetical protein